MAAIVVRCLRMACAGHFDDFRKIAAQQCIDAALQAFAKVNRILGFDLKIDMTEWGLRWSYLRFPRNYYKEIKCVGRNFSHRSIEELMSEVASSGERPDAFLAQMQILVGKLTCVQGALIGRVGIKWTPGQNGR